jgi:hypothetical protein
MERTLPEFEQLFESSGSICDAPFQQRTEQGSLSSKLAIDVVSRAR